MIGVGEIVFLAVIVLGLYAALRPLRRALASRFARALRRGPRRRPGQVVILERRRDGSFEQGERR